MVARQVSVARTLTALIDSVGHQGLQTHRSVAGDVDAAPNDVCSREPVTWNVLGGLVGVLHQGCPALLQDLGVQQGALRVLLVRVEVQQVARKQLENTVLHAWHGAEAGGQVTVHVGEHG